MQLDPTLGVFETLLVADGRVQALAAHLERLRASTTALYGLAPPSGLNAELRDVAERLGARDHGEHRLRVDVRPDGDHERLVASTRTAAVSSRPASFTLAPLPIPGGYGPHKLADRGPLTSSQTGGPVPLLVDALGENADVLEAAWANVWLLDGDALVTPPVDGRILPGVTRARLLEQAQTLGLNVTEERLTLARLRTAPAVFLTSSIQLAVPAIVEGSGAPSAEETATIEAIRSGLRQADWE